MLSTIRTRSLSLICLLLIPTILSAREAEEQIVVTGSRTLENTPLESVHAVDLLTGEELSKTAHAETGRAIQALAPSFNFPSTSIADGTDALKPATLRGLGPDQVLVLVNGLRRHKSALIHVNSSVGRGTAGTDMNALPTSFIGGIEILRDGAGAQYGSDAIAGVINIKLRDGRDGKTEGLTSWGRTTEGDGASWRTAINKGVELDNGALFIGYEYRDRGNTNRAGLSGTTLYTSPAGTTDSSNCNSMSATGCDPREASANRKNFRIGDSESVHHSGILNGEWEFSPALTAKGYVTVAQRDNESTGFFREPDDSNRNVVAVYPNGFLPEINTDIFDLGTAAGLEYSGDEWDGTLSYSYGKNTFDFFISNSINASFGAASPHSATAGGLKYSHHILNLDLKRALPLADLATGFEYKRETYAIVAGDPISWARCGDPGAIAAVGLPADTQCERNENSESDAIKSGGIQVFPGLRPTNALEESRNSTALYGELSHNFDDLLIANLAGRWEHYEDTDNAYDGKLALRLNMSNQHALRASVGSGFRAPSMHQLYFNNVSTQFVTVDSASVARETGTFRNNHPLAKELGVPALKSEEAINFSLGYVFNPNEDFSLTIDAYQIDIDDRIVLSGQVSANSNSLSDSARQILQDHEANSAQFFMNGPDTRTRGIDMAIRWLPLIPTGEMELSLTGNFTDTKVRSAFSAPQALKSIQADLFTKRDVSIIEDWQPNSRIQLHGRYSIGSMEFTGILSRYGKYKTTEGGNDDYKEQPHDSAYVFDLRVSWHILESTSLTLIGDNVFDQYPDEDNISNSRGGAIAGVVNSPGGVFRYSRRTSPYGFNGAFGGIELKHSF
ncbi:MAG: TonB-dependent receptor plug domain-containing protein [Candidatus Eutrophobiaceae bacterium]